MPLRVQTGAFIGVLQIEVTAAQLPRQRGLAALPGADERHDTAAGERRSEVGQEAGTRDHAGIIP